MESFTIFTSSAMDVMVDHIILYFFPQKQVSKNDWVSFAVASEAQK